MRVKSQMFGQEGALGNQRSTSEKDLRRINYNHRSSSTIDDFRLQKHTMLTTSLEAAIKLFHCLGTIELFLKTKIGSKRVLQQNLEAEDFIAFKALIAEYLTDFNAYVKYIKAYRFFEEKNHVLVPEFDDEEDQHQIPLSADELKKKYDQLMEMCLEKNKSYVNDELFKEIKIESDSVKMTSPPAPWSLKAKVRKLSEKLRHFITERYKELKSLDDAFMIDLLVLASHTPDGMIPKRDVPKLDELAIMVRQVFLVKPSPCMSARRENKFDQSNKKVSNQLATADEQDLDESIGIQTSQSKKQNDWGQYWDIENNSELGNDKKREQVPSTSPTPSNSSNSSNSSTSTVESEACAILSSLPSNFWSKPSEQTTIIKSQSQGIIVTTGA